jgi:hypothetical protein
MSEFSNAFASAILNYIRSGTALPAAGALTVALHNGDPGAQGLNNDVTATIRAAGKAPVSFGAIQNRAIANDAIVDFGSSAGNVTGNVSHFSVWSGTLCVGVSPLAAAKSVVTGAPVTFPVGSLIVDLGFALS